MASMIGDAKIDKPTGFSFAMPSDCALKLRLAGERWRKTYPPITTTTTRTAPTAIPAVVAFETVVVVAAAGGGTASRNTPLRDGVIEGEAPRERVAEGVAEVEGDCVCVLEEDAPGVRVPVVAPNEGVAEGDCAGISEIRLASLNVHDERGK